jgi:hypothetical protein
MSSKWDSAFRFFHQNPPCTSPLPHTYHMPLHVIIFYLITRIIFDEEEKPQSFSLCNFLQSPVISPSLRPKYVSQHPVLKHNQSSLYIHRASLYNWLFLPTNAPGAFIGRNNQQSVCFLCCMYRAFYRGLSQNQQMHAIINKYKMYLQPLHMFRQINCHPQGVSIKELQVRTASKYKIYHFNVFKF